MPSGMKRCTYTYKEDKNKRRDSRKWKFQWNFTAFSYYSNKLIGPRFNLPFQFFIGGYVIKN